MIFFKSCQRPASARFRRNPVQSLHHIRIGRLCTLHLPIRARAAWTLGARRGGVSARVYLKFASRRTIQDTKTGHAGSDEGNESKIKQMKRPEGFWCLWYRAPRPKSDLRSLS